MLRIAFAMKTILPDSLLLYIHRLINSEIFPRERTVQSSCCDQIVRFTMKA
jgi:hypothetical protein